MTKEAFLPLFFGDFLAATAEWEGEERALYLLMLGYQWSLGSLPAEPRRLCKLVGWDWALFERCWPTVSSKFQGSGNRLANARLEQHRERSKEISQKRAIAGAKGGVTTQAKSKQLLDTSQASASFLPGHPSHPIPSHPDQEPEKNKKPDRRTARAVDEPEGFGEFRQGYPKRAGGQRWGDALKFFRRRVHEGEKVSVILDGVQRYATFARATGIERTEKVQQAATFLGDNRGYLELWQPPPRTLSPIERVRERLNGANGDGRVVGEQGSGQDESSLGTVSRLLRRGPDS